MRLDKPMFYILPLQDSCYYGLTETMVLHISLYFIYKEIRPLMSSRKYKCKVI